MTCSIRSTDIITPAAPQILDTFRSPGSMVSIWGLGEGVDPFVAAPLPEYLGRAPGMGLRQIGFFAAPVVRAFGNQSLGWRWVQLVIATFIGMFGGEALVVVRKSYAVRTPAKKAAKLVQSTGIENLRIPHQHSTSFTAAWAAIFRPTQIPFSSPAMLRVRLHTGLACGLLVLVHTRLSRIMEQTYHFSRGTVGLAYLPTNVDCIVAMVLYGFTPDRYLRYKKTQQGTSRPEHRLIHMLLASHFQGDIPFSWAASSSESWLGFGQ
nr:efflux pump rdc3 [Quercus suber]